MLAAKIKSELNTLLTAWVYFVRVPLPANIAKRLAFSQDSLERSARYLPLMGVIVGLATGLSFILALAVFGDKALAVVISMVVSIALTGAFHEDGLADFFDAFGGGWWSKERILEIMKDSRIGTFGAVALILTLLLKFQSLTLIPTEAIFGVLVAAHAFSRLNAITFLFTHQYVRENDKSYFKPMVKGRAQWRYYPIPLVAGCVPLLFLGSAYYLLLVPALAVVTWLFGRYFTRKIGGYTGDCLGAAQQIVEVCFYLLFILLTTHIVA